MLVQGKQLGFSVSGLPEYSETWEGKLVFDIVTNKMYYGDEDSWEPILSSGVSIGLSGLNDVSITNPQPSDVLTYSGGVWINHLPIVSNSSNPITTTYNPGFDSTYVTANTATKFFCSMTVNTGENIPVMLANLNIPVSGQIALAVNRKNIGWASHIYGTLTRGTVNYHGFKFMDEADYDNSVRCHDGYVTQALRPSGTEYNVAYVYVDPGSGNLWYVQNFITDTSQICLEVTIF
jgi:hypothetical protein